MIRRVQVGGQPKWLNGTVLRSVAVAVGVLVSGSVANAAPIFSSSTSGLTSVMLAAGTYDIVATGAGGGGGYLLGGLGGVGAIVEGTFTFTAPETLSLLIGGRGGTYLNGDNPGEYGGGGGGGGGATFLVGPGMTPLLIAGGGGGGGGGRTGGSGGAVASVGGNGGTGPRGDDGGGGGGGLTGNGGYAQNGGAGGLSFTNGGAGGAAGYNAGSGGVGGGGGGGFDDAGGGGGGYTGGNGGIGFSANDPGAGGTSFNAGSNQRFSRAVFGRDGSVVITLLSTPVTDVPEPASLALLGAGLAGWAVTRRRRRA